MIAIDIAGRRIDDQAILAAFREVPRERFVPKAFAGLAYADEPLPIGHGQTISQPYMVARMIDAAGIGPGDRVFEVGAGSGYSAAVISRIAKSVISIERRPALASKARRRIEELGYDNCQIIEGDGCGGLPSLEPFDAILVAARASTVPTALEQQLAMGGRMIIPLGGKRLQHLRRIERTGANEWQGTDIAAVRFVPLITGPGTHTFH